MARFSETNRLFRVAAAAFFLLAGCPIYEDECDSRNDCARGYACDRFSRRCEPVSLEPGCRRPDQCGAAETCTPDFTCRPGSCEFHGCVSGYVCGVVDSTHACVLDADAAVSDSAAPNPVDASMNGDGTGDAGPGPADAASDASDAASNASDSGT
jgi:hypothetical protein